MRQEDKYVTATDKVQQKYKNKRKEVVKADNNNMVG